MKHEWRKHEKNLYIPKQKSELIRVAGQKFLMINGKGNPNSEDFAERIGALYSLAYAIRMMPKQGYTPEGYTEYTVYPLEGLWDLTEEGRVLDILDKDELLYTIMIRQPDFVTKAVVDKAIENVRKKKPNKLIDEVVFATIEDGLSVQILHVGSYDSEGESFQVMKDFINDNNLEIVTLKHREIYLSDVRRVEADKLKTVLRYQVKEKEKF
ncbi:MAG: GyrI-like domain-containing protein [Acidaminobacteraceae bacterium]